MALPGILAVKGPRYQYESGPAQAAILAEQLAHQELGGFPLVVLCDDAAFTAATLNNFLWVAFTRANPSHDLHGVDSFTEHKHWGCRGPLIIDARIKPHHAPELVPDPEVSKRVDMLFQKGGPLERWG